MTTWARRNIGEETLSSTVDQIQRAEQMPHACWLVTWYESFSKLGNVKRPLTKRKVLVQGWPPHLALAPLAQINPPLMPFRDAGYSQADFMLHIQDIVYGVWRAKEKNLLNLRDFDLEEYVRCASWNPNKTDKFLGTNVSRESIKETLIGCLQTL